MSIFATIVHFDGEQHPKPYSHGRREHDWWPGPDIPRAGELEVAAVMGGEPYVRVCAVDTFDHETEIVLDADQVRTLHAALTAWLEDQP